MIVVSNTSPLNYLILIELQHVLPTLFERVLIPDAVMQELRSSAAPKPVKDWLNKIPDWATEPSRVRHPFRSPASRSR